MKIVRFIRKTSFSGGMTICSVCKYIGKMRAHQSKRKQKQNGKSHGSKGIRIAELSSKRESTHKASVCSKLYLVFIDSIT